MKPAWILLALMLCIPAQARAGGPRTIPLSKVVESLADDLGAEAYDVRERATEALRRVGEPALKVIEAAAKSDDPEIRVRARDILGDLRLGIGADWPAEIVLLVRHYDRQDENQRYSVLQRIQAALGPRATPFLISRLEAGSDQEANQALGFIQNMNDPEVWQQVIELVKEPKRDQLARVLAWARGLSGQALDALETLARAQIKDEIRVPAREAAVQSLLKQLAEARHQDAANAAAKAAEAAPDDPRFLYLQAEALIPLDKDKEALGLRQRALALSPKKQAPHYLAGEMLGKLGRLRLAAREWEHILAIQPSDPVYDINAYLSLSSIHATNGLFEPAAEYLDKAIKRYSEAKKDEENGMIVPGGTLESLQMEVSRLRQRASQFPAPEGAGIDDAIPESEIQLTIEIVPKEGSVDDLRRALPPVAAQFHIRAQPSDLRVFDIASLVLQYDKDKKQILVLLHKAPACEPLPFDAAAGGARVAIHCTDCAYIHTIDLPSGKCEQIARLEKDYRVTLKPGVKIAGFTNVDLRVNGQSHKWEKALKGMTFDRLPDEFSVVLEGTSPLGKRLVARASISNVQEPTLEPLKAETKPAP